MRIGIDLGGTKIEAVALDAMGEMVSRHRVPTPRDSYPDVLAEIARLVMVIESEMGRSCSVGVGTPGAVSPSTGLIKNANSTVLNGRNLELDLGELLHREVRIHNDANCFALSEAIDGAGREAKIVFGVIVGTGTGAGVVVNRELLVGPNAIAGEWGHNQLPWPRADELPGPDCYCGGSGCIETFLSGPALSDAYRTHTGDCLPAAEIVARSGGGEPAARGCLMDYEDRMARGLAHVINILDPDVIVLGGGMSKIEQLYENVPRRWGEYVFSDEVKTRLLPPHHGDASGVRGAAWLWAA